MIASTVGFLTVILAVWLWRLKTDLASAARAGCLAAVIIQGVLGGMTVLFLLPKAVSISHACLAQLFSPLRWQSPFSLRLVGGKVQVVDDTGWPSLRSLTLFCVVMTLAQVALGAGFRHRAFGILPHIAGAIIVAIS